MKEYKKLQHLLKVKSKAFDLKNEENLSSINYLQEENELLKSKFTSEELASFQRKQSEVLQKKVKLSINLIYTFIKIRSLIMSK